MGCSCGRSEWIVTDFDSEIPVPEAPMRRTLRELTPLLLSLLIVAPAGQAQQPTGRVTGQIIDATNGTGLPGASVQVAGTTVGASAGLDGRFTLVVPATDSLTLLVRRIGYGPKTVTGIKVRASAGAAVDVVSGITAEQIAQSPDGDAAQAVGRVAGVSVQDGKYVFVRGLGDRYTQASLASSPRCSRAMADTSS